MAKPTTKKPEETKKNVVPMYPGADQVPDYVRAQKQQGRGTSQKAEDNLVPMVAVLQPLSPQLNKQNQMKYIPGAEVGDILIRGLEPPVRKEVLFQHCHFSKSIVEWIPRPKGGGFVGRHLSWPSDMTQTKSEDGRRTIMATKEGNHLIETRYHVGHIILEDGSMLPYIIPFSSTGHTVSRGWMNMMNAVKVEGGSVPDAWTRLYMLNTVQRQNAAGVWYVINPQPAGWASKEQAMKGEDLWQSFEKGDKQLGEEEDTGMDAGGTPEQGGKKF